MCKLLFFVLVTIASRNGIFAKLNPRLSPLELEKVLNDTLAQLGNCLTSWGYQDPQLGVVKHDPKKYCNTKNLETLRQIRGVTCCAPMSPSKIGVKFALYQPGKEPRNLNWRRAQDGAKLSPDPVCFIINGWLQTPTSIPYPKLKDGLVRLGCQVIMVDWTGGNGPQYFQSAANVQTVGKCVGYAIVSWGIANRTLAIGHSLGAQTLGEMGRYVKDKRQLVLKCVGLDPAGPAFDGGPNGIRLTKTDCALVQIVHTSAATSSVVVANIVNQHLGTMSKCGHCDYWVNCGHEQPGCQRKDAILLTVLQQLANQVVNGGPDPDTGLLLCSHDRAPRILNSSVWGTCQFPTSKCTGCGDGSATCRGQGEAPPFPLYSGCSSDMDVDVFLTTTAIDPFC
ncbi:Pancreatic lipase-related protein 2 [Halotydeus destructor]|nr:Pancreatic lipase-related protein 2 [Halotydeus destructor]